ncbi:YitT family protein [Anaerovibrio sp.]|uniref:YitT family protein n=1 Tax=Anaerovibrio sp. TaxID=1872532 RepID=UPI0025F7A84D|nr:YitT family protein [Anaerovibrio sp.]
MKLIERYGFIVLGCLISSCGINLFYVPSNLLTGGVTGISMVVLFLWGLPLGVQTFVYNIPLLIAAYYFLGKKYLADVIVGTVIFSVCLDLTQYLSALHVVGDVMLSSVFGGVLCGIGYGIVFRNNGSTGGFDIIGAIVKKYYSFDMGAVIFSFNCMIVVVAGFLFDVTQALFTLIGMFVSANITDKVIAGINHRKAVLIISDKAAEIADGIIYEVGRGVTFLHGQGAYTQKERNVVFVVVKTTQIAKIKTIVDIIDESAFMIIISANEVMGRGFTLPGLEIEKLRQGRKPVIPED